MPSLEDVAALREAINEPDDSNGWSDDRVGALIDAETTLNAAISRAWLLKAGQYAALVDVSESGSSRKLSDLRKNAMEMSTHYGNLDGEEAVEATGGRPIVQRIRRGFA